MAQSLSSLTSTFAIPEVCSYYKDDKHLQFIELCTEKNVYTIESNLRSYSLNPNFNGGEALRRAFVREDHDIVRLLINDSRVYSWVENNAYSIMDDLAMSSSLYTLCNDNHPIIQQLINNSIIFEKVVSKGMTLNVNALLKTNMIPSSKLLLALDNSLDRGHSMVVELILKKILALNVDFSMGNNAVTYRIKNLFGEKHLLFLECLNDRRVLVKHTFHETFGYDKSTDKPLEVLEGILKIFLKKV